MNASRPEFQLSAKSGLIAGAVSANSALFAWRNPPTKANGDTNRLVQRIKRLEVVCLTLTGFPTAQEIALEARYVSSFGTPAINYSGGTDLSDQTTTNAIRRIGPDTASNPKQVSVLQSGNVEIATTGALTNANTPVIATHPFFWAGNWELAAAATVQQGRFAGIWTPSLSAQEAQKGLELIPDTGFVITNPIALGSTGTVRMFVSVFFEEA